MVAQIEHTASMPVKSNMRYKVGDTVWAECRVWANGTPTTTPTGKIVYTGPVTIMSEPAFDGRFKVQFPFAVKITDFFARDIRIMEEQIKYAL